MENHFYSLNDYCREQFGEKLYKLSLNAGLCCPNRDGTLDTRGCIFCSAGGSGDFAAPAFLPIGEQIYAAKERVSRKFSGGRYIAYFQAYTNTYGPVEYLERIFTEAISRPEVAALSIATRPDCLPPEVLSLLAVSYTHLDVYKRQALTSMAFSSGASKASQITSEFAARAGAFSGVTRTVSRLRFR